MESLKPPQKHGQLKLVSEAIFGNMYGINMDYRIVKNIEGFTRLYIKSIQIRSNCKNNLVISSFYNGKHLPIIDADSQDDMLKAILWLRENGFTCTTINSSENRYWLIVDAPTETSHEMLNLIKLVPGCDEEYVEFSTRNDECFVRGLLQDDGFMPQIAGEGESHSVEFAGKILEHYGQPEILWLWRNEQFRKGNIDVSKPENYNFDVIRNLLAEPK